MDEVSALPSHAATPHLGHFYFARRTTFQLGCNIWFVRDTFQTGMRQIPYLAGKQQNWSVAVGLMIMRERELNCIDVLSKVTLCG